MVKYFILSLSFLFCFFKSSAQDTIKVNTHNKVVIKTNPSVGHTYYSSWGTFPAKDVSYRKVYLYLEFGCAPGLRCGEWDYLNHIYIGKKGGVNGDSLHYELARFITPYGFYWNSSQNWKHGWIFDVTEFSDILHDSVQILYKHTGYESNTDRGWTVTLDFNLSFFEKQHFIQYNNLVIAEVKADNISTIHFNTIMKKHKIRSGSLSKYCLGLISLNPTLKKNNFKMIFNQFINANNNG